MKSPILLAAIATLSIGSGSALAEMKGHGHGGGHDTMHAPAAAKHEAGAAHSEGTVRRIDATANKVTIAHGPLDNLGMPAMTMVFAVTGEASLEGVAVGDRVRFVAGRDGDGFVVTALEPQR